MELSTLTTAPGARKKRKRVGRGPGSGHGKTSGRGHKGQKARSGYSRRAGFEGGQMPLNRRLPKRGFRHQKRHPFVVVDLGCLDKHFQAGAEVTPASLAERGVVESMQAGVKILARGDLTKALTVKVDAVSGNARDKIVAAGGTVELVAVPVSRAVRLRNTTKREER